MPGERKLVHVALSLPRDVRDASEQRLVEAGFEVRFLPTRPELAPALPDCEFLLLGRPPRLDWSPALRLRLLQIAGAGVDPLFPAVGLREDVQIANCRGVHAESVRDHVLALLFAFARELPRYADAQTRRAWSPGTATSLAGRRLTLIGLGQVGTRVAVVVRALGMSVTAVTRTGTPNPLADTVLPTERLHEALRATDYLVLCVPATRSTLGMIGERELGALPNHAIVVNVARGGILDESALERALASGQLRGAGLDVFRAEPLPAQSSLWTCPGLIVTPHVAGWTPDYVERVVATFIENVELVVSGAAPRNVVSRSAEY